MASELDGSPVVGMLQRETLPAEGQGLVGVGRRFDRAVFVLGLVDALMKLSAALFETLLEFTDALADSPQELGNLLATEENEDDDQDDHPLLNADKSEVVKHSAP
jgi:hypothetical protein